MITGCNIFSVSIFGETAVFSVNQSLVERVVSAKACIVHIFICLDASFRAVGAVHQAHIVVTCRHAVPSLTRLLKVADVFVPDLQIASVPGQTAIVTAAAGVGAVNVAVSARFVVGAIDYQPIE